MSDGLIALFLGLGVSAWAYSQLAKRNGNATPSTNVIAALFAGLIVGFIFYTIIKYTLHLSQ
jgi:hypothetical protein